MPLLSAFTPLGLLELSGETSDAEHIYTTLRAQLEKSFDLSPGTHAEARLYALSIQMAFARAIVKRVPREMHPLSCYDLLTTLEKDWACVPSASDTLYDRKLRLAARKLLMRGSREEALVTDLTAAIGADFIKVKSCPIGSAANFPTSATTAGTFPTPARAPKFYKLLTSIVSTTVRVSVQLQCINTSAFPLAGENLTIEPEIAGVSEAFTVQTVTSAPGVTDVCTITPTAPFARAHSVGGWAVSAAPLWLSNRYQLEVIISDAASRNAEKRRKVNETMARHCKSCERWKLVAASSSTQVGPFVFGVGHNIIGATALGATPTNF